MRLLNLLTRPEISDAGSSTSARSAVNLSKMFHKLPVFIAFFLVGWLTASGQALSAEPPVPVGGGPVSKGQRIYACHHSYFLPIIPTLVELAATGGFSDQTIVGTHMIGGSKSIQHWNIPEPGNMARTALRDASVDVLILTPVYLPDPGIEKFSQFGIEHNPDIRIAVMEFWLPFDVYNPAIYDKNYQSPPGEPPLLPRPAKVDHDARSADELRKMHEFYFRTMDEHIAALNKQFGKNVLVVVPMGQAVIALREKIISGLAPGLTAQNQLFTDDLGHPGPVMQALEAYCFYAVIYRKSPVGLPVPKVLAKSTLPREDLAPLNRLLQELAWRSVTGHPLSGVAAPKAG